ncbi:sugar phosphate isomerase/epimerase and 4-hydroxyphenylpyruvate domain-containing protein [Azospirillum sp. TSO22-1]|uniref:bifunctional sugar phosphate isomerase/epimerase/4-hydroxyphenylpyruvate dioxygenase family protein n=1 Tax=Azospirillum sp. TSO22-1 TaxID=716789 RepID=UPI000D618AA6|nr:sugar phosphate isomerase/epimerase and 4-hydroxyphenylpyruvate domain-containing protein [Azospirillum sp. TSO22-1]PWC54829.1 3-keto-5-aminohexanoate cleavage protein [Azospirillum sp. TSO22-1]
MSAMPRTFRKSIATVSLSGTLPEKLEAAAAVGFDGVEIFENDLLTFDGSPADVRRIAEGLGLAITIFQPFRDFEAMPDSVRPLNLDRAERKFDIMQALGTDLVLVCSNVQPHAIDDDARAAADLAEMAERAARRGLRVGYEALAWGRHVNRWRRAWDIVRRADHPALGLIVDSFHTLAVGDDHAGIAAVPGEKLFFVQLADAPKLTMDALSWSRHFRNFPGQGELPVTGFLRAALAGGYDGPLSLEVFNDEFRAAPARQTAADGLRSLIVLEAEAGYGAGLPPPPTFDGFEFLEFAVDQRAKASLAALLETLGFHRAGRHRSKAVDLYRQGRANLVLNTEQDSAASEHFQMHGPSVCAMALRVDDAERAIARAEALRYATYQEHTGEGERRIPAVRAPDGTLVYLVQTDAAPHTIWEDDFHLIDGVGEGSGIDTIDHVALALPHGRMDSFVLFYRALFGLVPEQLWELPDPYGLIRSRAMVSADRSVRLPLNISESRRTATGRFVTASAGAGVHHVAFATSDIAGTVAAAAGAGAPLLPVPANYYDDLAARHLLDDAHVAELKARDLLFDRDDQGEFTHAYTDSFEDRFFFELVQRRGYQQFGAANAAVRMAVQAQLREAQHPPGFF